MQWTEVEIEIVAFGRVPVLALTLVCLGKSKEVEEKSREIAPWIWELLTTLPLECCELATLCVVWRWPDSAKSLQIAVWWRFLHLQHKNFDLQNLDLCLAERQLKQRLSFRICSLRESLNLYFVQSITLWSPWHNWQFLGFDEPWLSSLLLAVDLLPVAEGLWLADLTVTDSPVKTCWYSIRFMANCIPLNNSLNMRNQTYLSDWQSAHTWL